MLDVTRGLERERKKYRAALVKLTTTVSKCLDALDVAMKEPEGVNRGKRLAAISNVLEMANDHARYFALGVDYRTDKKGKAARPAKEGGADG